ncbi:MAG: hypothetical protein KAJ51_17405, partial [Thermoplasmata archaeon]|nr:hypothetical protein [Thermoplasmata archaeon]
MNKINLAKKRLLSVVLVFVMVSAALLVILSTSLVVPITKASSTWIQTTDADFNGGTLDKVSVVGTGATAELRLAVENGGVLCQGFGTSGVIQNNPSSSWDEAKSIVMDSNYIYIAGYDAAPGSDQWRIEKRDKATGALVTTFNGDGIIQENPSTYNDVAHSIAIDSNYIYIAGYDSPSDDTQWRIEKRDKTTGALVIAFGGNGNVTSNPQSFLSDVPHSIAVDSNYIYVAGYDQDPMDAQWRIEKRDKTTGALVTAFNGSGVVVSDPSTNHDIAYSIAVDSNYIYVTGKCYGVGVSTFDPRWRIEKRDKTTGALVTAFDGDGIIMSNPSGQDSASSIVVDSSYIYITGHDEVPGDVQWRIEKRDKTTGALVTAFDGDGVVMSNPSNGYDSALSIVVDLSYIYIGGYDYAPGNWQCRIEKRDKSTGVLITAFDGDGVVVSNPSSGSDGTYSIAVDSSYIYIVGSDEVPAPNDRQWRIEKRGPFYNNLGTYFSPVFDSGTSGTVWNTINWTENLPSGTDIT